MRKFLFLRIFALLWAVGLAYPSPLRAQDWEVGTSLSTVVSGTFNSGKSQKIEETSFGVHGYRRIKLKAKIAGKSQEIWLGAGLNSGNVTYSSSTVTRQGFHLQLGLLSTWRVFIHKTYYLGLDLNLFPVNQTDIFSKVNTILNDERTSTTSQTHFSGFGWGLGLSGGRNFQFKFMGVKFNLGVLPFLRFNSESFNSRYDKVVVVNKDSGSVDVSESTSSSGATSSYINLGLTFNFVF